MKGRYTKRFFVFASFVLIVTIVASLTIGAQSGDSRKSYLTSLVLLTFEDAQRWEIPTYEQGGRSQFFKDGEYSNKENGSMMTFPILKSVEAKPDGMGMMSEHSTNSLGVTVGFFRKGYNHFDLRVKEDKKTALDKRIPGKVQQMDLWVWGGRFDYSMDMYLEDYKGYVHKLPLGSLNYRGWKNLKVNIPPTIPQAEPYAPRVKGLSFSFFRFKSAPAERADRFHVYLDHMKLITDLYSEQYDGDELEKELLEDIGEDTSSTGGGE